VRCIQVRGDLLILVVTYEYQVSDELTELIKVKSRFTRARITKFKRTEFLCVKRMSIDVRVKQTIQRSF
jgi:hypothetical protein